MINSYQIKIKLKDYLDQVYFNKSNGTIDDLLSNSEFSIFTRNVKEELDLRLKNQSNITIDYIDGLYLFGLLLCETNQVKTGFEYLVKALEQVNTLLESHELVSLYDRKIEILKFISRLSDKSTRKQLFIEILQINYRILRIESSNESLEKLASNLHNFADSFYCSSSHTSSKLLEQSMEIRKKILDSTQSVEAKIQYISSLNTLALHLWWNDKNYLKAEDLFKEAIQMQLAVFIQQPTESNRMNLITLFTCLIQIKRDQNRFREAQHLETIIRFINEF